MSLWWWSHGSGDTFNVDWSWTGTYANGDGGAGRLYLCQGEDGVVQGQYAGLGVVQGVASGNQLVGAWYEAGEGSGSTASHGEMWLTMYRTASGGVWFSGQWTYGFGEDAVAGSYDWTDTRVNASMPSAKQCFSSSVAGSTLASGSTASAPGLAPWSERLSGKFNVLAGDPPAVFDLCPLSNGSSVGSYTWTVDNAQGVCCGVVGCGAVCGGVDMRDVCVTVQCKATRAGHASAAACCAVACSTTSALALGWEPCGRSDGWRCM